jgi:transcriptional regulator with XRE-family HTH domain
MSKFAKLGQLLKRRRIENGITQIGLAQKLGYSSPQFVSNWERGQCNPAFDTLPAISVILGISKKEIIEIIVNETRLELEANFKTKARRKSR